MSKILLVDDDPQGLESTRKILEFAEYEVTTATDGQMALDKVRAQRFDVVITDVRMPKLGGLEFLRALSLCGESIPVILMTAFGRVEDAVWAMKWGAVDFLTKPFKRQALLSSVESVLKRTSGLGARGINARGIDGRIEDSDAIIGRSTVIVQLKEMIRRVAPTQVTILLTGESGTGKELVARSIHKQSHQSQGPFIALNCAAVPDQLMESELFGFEKGAFTGATAAKRGLFEAAHGGTLLLDEIGDMPITLQAKLLRALQEGEIRPVGSTLSKKVEVRVIAATHKKLKQCVAEGSFRQDLLYRLEVMGIHVPPLRDRADDIPELVSFFVDQACKRNSKKMQPKMIQEGTLKILCAYPWPGNIRELSNVVERAVVLSVGDVITTAELPTHVVDHSAVHEAAHDAAVARTSISVPLGTPLKEVEELLIRKTLEATAGDKNMTAKLLGIHSRTIYRKLDKKEL